MNSINIPIPSGIPLQPTVAAVAPGGAGATAATDGPSFKDFLLNSIQQVNSMQQEADKAVEDMFTGGDTDPATVLTAVQKADMAFRMMMQIRNKLSSAYDEFKYIRI
jgi:flagellar hook-basal body complex protein FliE